MTSDQMIQLPAPLPWTKQIPLIGLGYRIGSGKDTVADYLVRQHGFVKFAFAGALKKAARDLCGFTEAQVNGSLAEKEALDPRWGWSARYFMQKFGTEIVRSIDPEFWIKVMDQTLRGVKPEGYISDGQTPDGGVSSRLVQPRGVVLSDMRFPNELAAIRAWGGFAVEVYRPEAQDRLSAHASENSLLGAKFDDKIVNAGTLKGLYVEVDATLEALARARNWRGR